MVKIQQWLLFARQVRPECQKVRIFIKTIVIKFTFILHIYSGVCLSHAAIMNQVANLGYYSSDLVLSFSTLYWISGLLMLLSSVVQGFCRIITSESFSPDLMLDMIEEHQVRMCVAYFSNFDC